jgi:hypothetical protein
LFWTPSHRALAGLRVITPWALSILTSTFLSVASLKHFSHAKEVLMVSNNVLPERCDSESERSEDILTLSENL